MSHQTSELSLKLFYSTSLTKSRYEIVHAVFGMGLTIFLSFQYIPIQYQVLLDCSLDRGLVFMINLIVSYND